MTATPASCVGLPDGKGRRYVTDGGLETDLIFHHGVDLPSFAAFPLLDGQDGITLLERYYDDYATIAERADAGLLLESPTWRANPDWGSTLGYDAAGLTRVNAAAIDLLARLREHYAARTEQVIISGTIGPRGDGYVTSVRVDRDEAATYHAPQLSAFAAAGADLATAYTLTDVEEAIGIVQAARAVALPIAISFTVETDGRLPDGTTIAAAIDTVDDAAAPDYYLINCAHPSHIELGLTDNGQWRGRIAGLRANASTKSHAELDDADDLDEGDIAGLTAAHRRLVAQLPKVSIIGGCCGTDHRHVAALWADAERA